MWRIWGLFWCFQGMRVTVGWGRDRVMSVHLLMDVRKTILLEDTVHWGVPSSVQVLVISVCRYRPWLTICPRVYIQRKVVFLSVISCKLENSRGKQILWTWNSPTKSAYFLLPPLLPPFFFFFFFIAIGFLLCIDAPNKADAELTVVIAMLIFTCLCVP